MKVALTEAVDAAGMLILREAGLDLVVGRGGEQSADELRALCAETSAVLVRQQLPDDLPTTCPRLLICARPGAGVDMIPVEACTAAGILVTNVPGANANAVAEFVFAQILAAMRRVREMHAALLTEGWTASRAIAAEAEEIGGRTIGIVGVGAIGQRVAEIARHGFRMRVLGHQRRLDAMPGFVTAASLPELFAESDIIVLACPLTEATRGLVSAELIARMKPTAWLCNVARGPVVDEPALVAALRERCIGGAALDVYATQPLAPDHPLRGLSDVVLSGHIAGLTRSSAREMAVAAATDVVRALRGERPVHLLNPEAWEAYRMRREAP
jgi:D-3-phosphoglycerate dehydrogenase